MAPLQQLLIARVDEAMVFKACEANQQPAGPGSLKSTVTAHRGHPSILTTAICIHRTASEHSRAPTAQATAGGAEPSHAISPCPARTSAVEGESAN